MCITADVCKDSLTCFYLSSISLYYMVNWSLLLPEKPGETETLVKMSISTKCLALVWILQSLNDNFSVAV